MPDADLLARSGGIPLPFSWKIDRDARLAHVRGSGPMLLEETLAAPHQLVEDPGFDPSYNVLVDLIELEVEPAPEEVVAVARNLVELQERLSGRIAVVVPEEFATAAELVSAMAASGGFEAMVFTEASDARAWLDGGGEAGS